MEISIKYVIKTARNRSTGKNLEITYHKRNAKLCFVFPVHKFGKKFKY